MAPHPQAHITGLCVSLAVVLLAGFLLAASLQRARTDSLIHFASLANSGAATATANPQQQGQQQRLPYEESWVYCEQQMLRNAPWPKLLAACMGVGAQLAAAGVLMSVVALTGAIAPYSRGSWASAYALAYVVTAPLSGGCLCPRVANPGLQVVPLLKVCSTTPWRLACTAQVQPSSMQPQDPTNRHILIMGTPTPHRTQCSNAHRTAPLSAWSRPARLPRRGALPPPLRRVVRGPHRPVHAAVRRPRAGAAGGHAAAGGPQRVDGQRAGVAAPDAAAGAVEGGGVPPGRRRGPCSKEAVAPGRSQRVSE